MRQVVPTPEDLMVGLARSPRLYSASVRPYNTGRFLLRRAHDPDYAVFGLFEQTDGLFLDVGANSGSSALSFRLYQRRGPILSVEPNPYHENDLRWSGRLAQPHGLRLCAAGARFETLKLYIPHYRGSPITAEASVVPGFVERSSNLRAMLGARLRSPAFSVRERLIPVEPLDHLRLSPAFIKLDVQGFEHQALLGLRDTLARTGAPTLIECPDEDVNALMDELGYQPFAYDPERQTIVPAARRPKAINVLFLSDRSTAMIRHG